MSKDRANQPAGLAYHGHSGLTRACEETVIACHSGRAQIIRARILARKTSHGLLLIDAFKDELAILPGFASAILVRAHQAFPKFWRC